MSSLANHAADAVRAEAQGAAAAPAAPTADPKRWYVLGMLTLVYATMHMDRHIVTLLLEPIKLEFALTDTQLGFLAGLSFAIAFSAAGIPLGLLVDRVNRVRLLSVLITLWSGLTFICGFATSYLMLVLARIGIGCAESGGSPTSSSLIGDFFRRTERPVAFGVYHTGTQIGSIIGFAAAAMVAQAYGWRAAFLIAGLPGLLLMVVMLASVREPRRGACEEGADGSSVAAKGASFGETLRFLISQRAQVHSFIGFVVAMSVTSGLSAWLAPLMMRSYGVSLKTAGFAIAFGVSTCGVLGALLGGWLAGRVSTQRPGNLPRLTALAMLLSVPAALTGILANHFGITVAGYALQHFCNSMITATSFALVLELTQVRMRGTTMALLLVLSNMFGYGLGPQLVGLLSDALRPALGEQALRWALVALALCNFWAMAHLLAAARWTAGDLARARGTAHA